MTKKELIKEKIRLEQIIFDQEIELRWMSKQIRDLKDDLFAEKTICLSRALRINALIAEVEQLKHELNGNY